ncbi:MAG TPA: hypothetical protein VIH99_12670 [Bdellovibrionota bacterium]|jgi:hypothetical protein
MKNILFIMAASLLSFSAQASSPARDALLGTYQGLDPQGQPCKLQIAGIIESEETALWITTRELTNHPYFLAGTELEMQLNYGANPLRFQRKRSSWGTTSDDLAIALDPSGKPVALTGTVEGLTSAKIDCRFY